MAVFLCPHCDDVIELLGDRRTAPPQCECGALMEPVEAGEPGPALDLSDPAQRDQAVRAMLGSEL